MAEPYADLELAFRWVPEQGGLDVGLRFVLSDAAVDNWVHLTELLKIDLKELARRANDADAYAESLTRMVFSRPDIADFYNGSYGRAAERPVHLRLNLDTPPAFHEVHWELLRDPTGEHPLATTDRVLFSRYLSSPDFRMVPWRTKQASRALVVIASPSDLGTYRPGGQRLAEVGIETVYLAGPGQATLANLVTELEKQVDILHLVCHGAVTGDVPFIFLESPDGTADIVDGRRLAEMVFSLASGPAAAR